MGGGPKRTLRSIVMMAALLGGLTTVSMTTVTTLTAGPASGSTPCGASGVPTSGAGTDACTYTTAGEDTFTVPTGVSQLSVVVIGAAGGAGGSLTGSTFLTGATGGSGAKVTAVVPVMSGTTLYTEVGSDGADATGNPALNTCGPGGGGDDGGGAGGASQCNDEAGGGGGGGSDLRTTPA